MKQKKTIRRKDGVVQNYTVGRTPRPAANGSAQEKAEAKAAELDAARFEDRESEVIEKLDHLGGDISYAPSYEDAVEVARRYDRGEASQADFETAAATVADEIVEDWRVNGAEDPSIPYVAGPEFYKDVEFTLQNEVSEED